MSMDQWLGIAAVAGAFLFFVLFRRRLWTPPELNEEIAVYLDSGAFYHVKGVERGETGDYAGAEAFFRLEAARLRQRREPGDPDLQRARENIAVCLNLQYRMAEAETVYREQLAELESTAGKTNPATMDSRLNLVRCLRNQGKLDDAEALLREQAGINGKLFSTGHEDENDAVLLEQAAIHSMRGEHEAAADGVTAIIGGKERRHGASHPETLRFRRILAGELLLLGRRDEAESLLQAIREDQERLELRDDLSATEERLAEIYLQTGRAAEAGEIFDRIQESLSRRLPPGHPDLYRLAGRRAAALEASGESARAEMIIRNALAGFEARHGPRHIDAMAHREMLANLLERQNRDGEAGDEYRQLVADAGAYYGPESQEALRARFSYGSSLMYQGRLAEAEAELRYVHRRFAATAGANAAETLRSAERLARALNAMERCADARALLEPAATEAAAAMAGQVDYWPYLETLARAQAATGSHEEAAANLRTLLALVEEGTGRDAPGTLRLMGDLAENLIALERYGEAETVLTDLCDRTASAFGGTDSGEWVARRRRLAETQALLGKDDDAVASWTSVLQGCERLEAAGTDYHIECLDGIIDVLSRQKRDGDAKAYQRERDGYRPRLAHSGEPEAAPRSSYRCLMWIIIAMTVIRLLVAVLPSRPALQPGRIPLPAHISASNPEAVERVVARMASYRMGEALRESGRSLRYARAVERITGTESPMAIAMNQVSSVAFAMMQTRQKLRTLDPPPSRTRQR